MADKLGPAFHVSRIGVSSQFGGDTFTIKAHFHDRDTAEVVRRVMLEEKLPHGPFPQQFAEQAELIDIVRLEKALVRCGCSAPSGEMLSWWVGREVNRLIDCVLNGEGVKTAPLTEEQIRHRFEHWQTAGDSRNLPAIERSGEGYKLAQTQSDWTAWKAAFANSAGSGGVHPSSNDQRQVRKDSQGLGEPGRLSPSAAGAPKGLAE